MDATERLLAIEDIRQLKARYFRLLDAQDWSAYLSLFALDAVMDMRDVLRDPLSGEPPRDELYLVGLAAIEAFVLGGVSGGRTVHLGHMAEIDITSAATASAIWVLEDYGRWPQRSSVRRLHGLGHLYDDYERIDGRWLIKRTRMTRMMVDTE